MARDNPVVTKTAGDKTVKIFYDADCNPRDNQDNFGTILYLNKSRYRLGDKATSPEAIQKIVKCEEFVHLPVYAYIHGNVALSTGPFSCQWDSGQSGIVYISKEKIRTNFGAKRLGKNLLKKAYDMLSEDVRECSKILNGEVYGFVLEDKEGNEIDSCWGFVEDPDKLAEDVLSGRV